MLLAEPNIYTGTTIFLYKSKARFQVFCTFKFPLILPIFDSLLTFFYELLTIGISIELPILTLWYSPYLNGL